MRRPLALVQNDKAPVVIEVDCESCPTSIWRQPSRVGFREKSIYYYAATSCCETIMLYRLSYGPFVSGPEGFEPPTGM